MNTLKEHAQIIILLVTGFILRFTISFTHSFSSDELSAINRLNINGFDAILEGAVMKGDMHPAGVQLFEEFWTSIFGVSEIALRFPFVIMGVLSIWLTYLIGKTFLTKNTGLIAAGLITITCFPIIHSELARPYSPGLLFSLMVAWFWLKLLFSKNEQTKKQKWIHSIGLGVSFALAMYTHYFAFMFVGFIGLTGLLFLKKEIVFHYIFAGILGVLLFLPHLEITLYHLSLGGIQWLGRPEYDWLAQYLFYVFNESWILIIVLLITAFIAYFKFNKKEGATSKVKLLFILGLWFFGIYFIGHIFSYVSSPILKFPVMLFALPFLFLLLGSIFAHTSKKVFNVLFAAILILGTSSTIIEKDLYGNEHFEVFKELVEPMMKWRAEYGADNIISYMNVSNPNYLNYYASKIGDSLTFKKDVLGFSEDLNIRKELLNATQDYCVIGYSGRYTVPQIYETCKEFYPVVLEYKELENCAVFLLAKEGKTVLNTKEKTLSSFFANPSIKIPENSIGKWFFNPKMILKDSSENYYFKSDSTNVYNPDFIFRKKDIHVDYNYYLKIIIEAKGTEITHLISTLTAKRNGEAVVSINEEAIWMGHDMENMLNYPSDNNCAYYALRIPPEIRDDDDIQIGLWNENGSPIKVYSVKINIIENNWDNY